MLTHRMLIGHEKKNRKHVYNTCYVILQHLCNVDCWHLFPKTDLTHKYNGCWLPGFTRSQGISRHNIGRVNLFEFCWSLIWIVWQWDSKKLLQNPVRYLDRILQSCIFFAKLQSPKIVCLGTYITWQFCRQLSCSISAGIILHMRPANERRRYIVMSSLIGWVHSQNDACIRLKT